MQLEIVNTTPAILPPCGAAEAPQFGVCRKMRKQPTSIQMFLGRLMLLVACLGFASLFTLSALAQTDIPSTITALSGYWTSIATVAIVVLLFVVGRRLVRKL